MSTPEIRLRTLNDRQVNPSGAYILYWMTSARRASHNFALDHALSLASQHRRPLLVFEAVRAAYRWASDRHTGFILQGMSDNARAFAALGITYVRYVEQSHGDGKGLLTALAVHAACVVTDDYPVFFLPRMTTSAAAQCPVQMVAVDSNGVLPMRAAAKSHPTAYAFRRFLQGELPKYVFAMPMDEVVVPPVARGAQVPADVMASWPSLSGAPIDDVSRVLAGLHIDHTVGAAKSVGGTVAARAQLQQFLGRGLERYAEERSDPDLNGQSHLSPWLHFGHLSAHEVVRAVWQAADFDPSTAFRIKNGSREGYWGISAAAEGFLDELITWRELGFNFALHNTNHDQFTSLPLWAQTTLMDHAGDVRPHTYSLEQLTHSKTHDELWNAAQRQLVREGVIHNYLRMLWGKKILEWSATPQQAAETMIELNNRYAIDGRDPNSYSGIFWCLGRFDRPWGPLRPIFGSIRYMSSTNTAKKHNVKEYLKRYSDERQASLF